MLRLLRFGILGALLVAGTSACFVRTERTVVATPSTPTCSGAVWVDAHYDPHGRWVPGSWRCARVTY
jgi:hypothetical protein